MTSELRKTGISVVGDVPWGTHFCYFYETKQDLLDILIPYFKTGLENQEFCLWVISDSELLTEQEATNALRKALPDLDRYVAERSIEVVSHNDWFLIGGTFDLYKVANRFKEKLDEALARGYAGMRLNGSPAWLYRPDDGELVTFEKEVDKLFPDLRVIASCTYPIAGSAAGELLDVADAHRFVITRRRGNWEILETPELMQTRAELKKLSEELEQRVIERTRELAATNQELRKEIAERQRGRSMTKVTGLWRDRSHARGRNALRTGRQRLGESGFLRSDPSLSDRWTALRGHWTSLCPDRPVLPEASRGPEVAQEVGAPTRRHAGP